MVSVVSDRITGTFNKSGVTRTVALDIFITFGRIWHDDLLHKLKSYRVSGHVFNLILSFFSNRQFQIVLDGTFLQENPFMLVFLKSSLLVLH